MISKKIMAKHILNSIILMLAFWIAKYRLYSLTTAYLFYFDDENLRRIQYYGAWLLLIILVTGYLYGFKNVFKELGLGKGLLHGFIKGFLLAMIFVTPMFTGSYLLGYLNKDSSIFTIFINDAFYPGFFLKSYFTVPFYLD